MKKFLLLISAMLVMTGIINAQDVYSAGYYRNSSNKKVAAVYKNNQNLYEKTSGTYQFESTSVVCKGSDVYWSVNWFSEDGNTHTFADIYKNGSVYLNSSTSGRSINDMFTFVNNIYAVGYQKDGSINKAVVWKNDDQAPYKTFGANDYESNATSGVPYTAEGNYFVVGGYQCTSISTYHGVIWYSKTNSALYTFPDGTKILDIFCYNNDIYSVGTAVEGSVQKLKVWRNNNLVYTLYEPFLSNRASIWVDANDIYVAARGSSYADIIWKNGTELYYGSIIESVIANTDGVYAAGYENSGGIIWKDGTTLYTLSNCELINSMYIAEPECTDSDVRTLPFTETFENGETEWACWTKVDTDGSGSFSSWERSGTHVNVAVQPYAGDYCARHGFTSASAQEGWLISPRIFLQPGRDNTTLTFKSYEQYPNDMEYEGVLVSTTSTSTSAFTEVWSQNNASATWKDVNISLAAYQGQAVYIAFKYTGQNGHSWFIDNISITESWNPCGVKSVPYTMNFDSGDNEPGYCWYNLDLDHSGDGRHWKYNSSEQCAYHPYGQQNMPQQGALFTPYFNLPSGANYTMTFNTKTTSSGDNMFESVGVIVDPNTLNAPNVNDAVFIWQESTYSSSWVERSIDLTQYAGHTICICFFYQGVYARNWYIDDFTITNATPQYNINVVANNASWGTVTGGGTYDQGANVTISATPNSGYNFLKWTKDGTEVSTNASYSFTATENATYTAVFGEQSVNYYTITAEASPLEAALVEGGGTYAEGETVMLAVSPNMGWIFDQWQDGNTDNPRTITVTGDATYTAECSQMTYSINVSANPAEGGTVEGSGTYPYGEYVVLRAHANEGYDFLNWNDGNTDDERVIVVDGDADYVAYFAEQGATTYTITVLSADPELGSVSGGGTFTEGTVITISAEPVGYATFTRWNDGNTNATRNVTVTGDATYTAYFQMGTLYTITVESLNPEMGTVSGGGEFPAGAEIAIQATAFGGYHFNGWDDNNYENPRMITVTGNATYRARFSDQQQETYTITVMCNTNEGTVIGGGSYPAGTTIQIAAIPNAGFLFKEWNDGNTQNPRSITVTGNALYFATFRGDGIDENGAQIISLYPNPAKDVIRIDGLNDNTEVRIYNVLGGLVKVVNVNSEEEISISELPAGMYIVRFGASALQFTKE